MLVLALDTATDVVAVGLLDVPGDEAERATVLAARESAGARRHGERLMPMVLEVCAAAGLRLAELDAVVCGAGPGPFTGLRVGLVSAAGLGDALGVPVYPVCSLDAVAAELAGPGAGEPLLVISDARRGEVYWAVYGAAERRTAGPAVHSPDALAEKLPGLGARRVAGPVAAVHAELLGLPEHPSAGAGPSPAGLVSAAGEPLRARRAPPPLTPYYLRRPDAVPPSGRKRVTVS